MKVYLLKDIENVGMAGQVVSVSDGFARNFLIPRHLAKEVGKNEEKFFEAIKQKARISAEALKSKIAMTAERIRNMVVTVKEKTHDDGKLYGSVTAEEIVEALKDKGISVSKKQIEFKKAIKSVGEHKVIVKLTAKLKPELTVKVTEKK